MATTDLTIGQPVIITTGLPYSMTWEENDDLEGREGILVHIDADEFERAEPVPYRVQLAEAGEPVSAQAVRLIEDPAYALRVSNEAAWRLAERADKVTGDFHDYSLATGGRLARIQEFADHGDMPDAVRAQLLELLGEE